MFVFQTFNLVVMPRTRPLSTTEFCKAFPLVDLILIPYLRGGNLIAELLELISDVEEVASSCVVLWIGVENLSANICQTFH